MFYPIINSDGFEIAVHHFIIVILNIVRKGISVLLCLRKILPMSNVKLFGMGWKGFQ